MFAKPVHLHVRRPSPTTVEFTVTTRPPTTLALRLLLCLVALGRLALAAASLFLVYTKWTLCPYAVAAGAQPLSSPSPLSPTSPVAAAPPSLRPPPAVTLPDPLVRALVFAAASPAGRLLARLAAASPVWALLPACGAALYLAVRRVYTTETLLVLRGLGIQTSSSGRTLLAGGGSGGARFIPTEKVRDVLINEAFRGFEVRYYLAVVVEGEEDLVVVFPGLLPGRRAVETVWRGVRSCLYEPPDTAVTELPDKDATS